MGSRLKPVSSLAQPKLIVREDRVWEQIVFAEVVLPNVVNNYGDISTPEMVVEFCHEFARQGYGIDINHDEKDVTGKCYVAESFIARPGDPDFMEGAWVVGMKVPDPDIWAMVLAGELNGFSYQAMVEIMPVIFTGEGARIVTGTTSAHPVDGHTHTYALVLDLFDNPAEGGTSETNGHSHRILSHTTVEVAEGHNHRYAVLDTAPETDSDE